LSINSSAEDEFSIETGKEKGFWYTSFNVSSTQGDVFIFSRDMENVTIKFSVEDSTTFRWYEYENDPGVDTVRLAEIDEDYVVNPDGKSSILKKVKGNHGYYVKYGEEGCEEEDTCMIKYVWIAIYEPIDSVTWEKEFLICDILDMQIYPKMEYILATNSGRKSTGLIDRDLKIEYLTFKDEDRKPDIYEVTEEGQFSAVINLTVPYVDTDFIITDNLGIKLKHDSAVFVTDTFYTPAVIAFPAMSAKDKEENELDPNNSWEKDDFGNIVLYFSESPDGDKLEFRTSAPLSVDIISNASPKVNKYEWHISRDANFLTDFVYYEKDLNNYVFSEPGDHYIKLVVWNMNNVTPLDTCRSVTYANITIAESAILVPNVFTPNGDGINDEFKVAYRSIESFHCRVYNQWGRKVYDSTDITRGWDGNIGGKAASIGVYFYVIEAKGTDGRVHKKRGDINLLRSK